MYNLSLARSPDLHFMALGVALSSQGQSHSADQCKAELPLGVPVSSLPWVSS